MSRHRPVSRNAMLLVPLLLTLVVATTLMATNGGSSSTQYALDPVAQAAPAALSTDPMTAAEQARQRGDIEQSLSIYRSLLQGGDASLSDEARARLAGVLLGARRFAEAAEVAAQPEASSSAAARARSSYVLAEAARGQNDCAAAIGHYERYLSAGGVLAPYARFGLIKCAESLNEPSVAANHAQAILDASPHRRLRIEALERLAAAELKRGNARRSLAIHDELYDLGATRSYKASMLWEAARVARELDDRAGAVDRMARLVREFPEDPRAADALNALNAMQAADAITWTQAGLVRLQAREFQAAYDGFEVALEEAPNGPEAATARYNRAVAILRMGRELEAARDMRSMAARHPGSATAPVALLRAGRIIESNDLLDEAEVIYAELVNGYPSTNPGRNGRFRLGLVRYVQGDVGGAVEAWEPLSRDEAERDLQSLATLWLGKAAQRLGNSDGAAARWKSAIDVGPDTFGGLRAAALLAGNGLAEHQFRVVTPPVGSVAADAPELDSWLEAHGTSRDVLEAERTQDIAWQRAVELTRLGQRDYATWEMEAVAAHSAPHKFQLAELQMTNGFTSMALRTAEATARELGVPRTSLPVALQRLLFPLGFDDLLLGSAQRHQADGMLLAALVRQESRFDPQARSVADARGLSQIVPSTGRSIAAALGRSDFAESELYYPATNLDFGAYYLRRQLDRYGGLTLPALAAYNAGAGAVDRWLAEYGRADMDLFAERIPYTETNHYLHVVYENAAMYRRLYQPE